MAKRLLKVAKELNVGTGTIVDHLNAKGFEVENKPNAKLSDEMYGELLKEFQKSIAIKEQANNIVIGNRPGQSKDTPKVEEKPVAPAPKPAEPKPAPKPKPVAPKPPPPKPEPVVEPPKPAEPKPEPTPEPEPIKEKEEVPDKPQIGVKVVGKVDLDKKPKAKQKETPSPDKAEVKKVEQEKPAEKKAVKKEEAAPAAPKKEEKKVPEPAAEDTAKEVPAPKPTTPPAEKSKPEKKEDTPEASPATDTPASEGEAGPAKVVRAEAPELRGLKIQGKIDLNKFSRPKKSKKKTEAKPGAATGKSGTSKEGEGIGGDTKKRRRKRKTVSAPAQNRSGSGGGGNRRGRGGNRRNNDEPKEVSQKEIDEKIKATMARISGAGGGKRKRQKIRRSNRERQRERQEQIELEMENEKLQVTEFISVQELANLMDVDVSEVIMACMNLGVIVSINQRLDAEIIEVVAEEFNHEVEFISVEEQSEEEEEIEDDPEDLEPRAPIVTVMGHVDHGKTSLLDYIREAKVADGEAGGITQHIGAYEVRVGPENKKVTFLDTPGHEAFTAMRARGAKVTDIAVIIIAADDNIMPQTKEAISHAQAAEVPMVFAINKVDKPGAQPERIKQELASMNLLVEEWGGQYQSQDISAKTGQGIPDLLEKLTLEAEILELQANPDRNAVGTVIEASLDKGRGYVTKMLVQTGTLEIGDVTLAGEHSGKVKAMFNERGKRIKKAGPSTPVLMLGLSGAPQAGERFKVMDSEQEAKQIATKRMQIAREQANRATKRISLDEIGRRLALGNFKELNLIVKGDVDGSVEALSDSLIKQSIETVQVNVLHKAVGQIVESDVLLATASDAIIIGFQVRPSLNARKLAEREGVEIKMYSIIYKAIEEIRAAIEGMLEPTKEEKITAQLEVRNVFKISKVGTVAGCYVQEGKISRNSKIRLIRDGIVVYPTKEGQEAELSSLKRFKEDVREVKSGLECGLSIKNFNDIKVGDNIEAYEVVEIKQTLDSI